MFTVNKILVSKYLACPLAKMRVFAISNNNLLVVDYKANWEIFLFSEATVVFE